MARAAIVVVPSRWQEPFGLTALEALACGAALICSRRGGLPEIGGDVAVYADPDDPRALADAIRASGAGSSAAAGLGAGRAVAGAAVRRHLGRRRAWPRCGARCWPPGGSH